jgi:hypothetical protein
MHLPDCLLRPGGIYAIEAEHQSGLPGFFSSFMVTNEELRK